MKEPDLRCIMNLSRVLSKQTWAQSCAVRTKSTATSHVLMIKFWKRNWNMTLDSQDSLWVIGLGPKTIPTSKMVLMLRCTICIRVHSMIGIFRNSIQQILMPPCTNFWRPQSTMGFLTIISPVKLMLMSRPRLIRIYPKNLLKQVSCFWRMMNLRYLWGNLPWELIISLWLEMPPIMASLISTAQLWLKTSRFLILSICFVRG